jgi:hypothetical protein
VYSILGAWPLMTENRREHGNWFVIYTNPGFDILPFRPFRTDILAFILCCKRLTFVFPVRIIVCRECQV